jgi:diacylglycerol kinase (ATP)
VGPSIGGGFIVAPEARPDDGVLDLLLVEPLSFTEIVRILPSVVRGTLKSTSKVYLTTVTGGRLAAPSGGQFFFELDGERMEDSTPWIEFRILPGVLQVMDRGGMGPRPEGR